MTILGRSEELVSRCVECDLAEPESLASLGGSAPGLVDGILSLSPTTKFNLIPFDHIKEPLCLPKQQIGSEQVPQHLPHLASTELEGFFQSFKVLLQPSNELKIISQSNLSSTTLTLDKHSSTASTTNTGLAYLTSILWRLPSTHTLKTDLSQKSL